MCNVLSLAVYQTHSPLTIDNFTFQKDPIYKEPYEIVRMAGSHGRRGRPSGTHKSPQPPKPTAKKQPKSSPKKAVTVSPVVTTATPRIVGKKVIGKVIVAQADVLKVVPSSSASENKPVIRAVAKKHMGKRGPSKSAATCSVVTPPALKKAKVDDDASRYAFSLLHERFSEILPRKPKFVQPYIELRVLYS